MDLDTRALQVQPFRYQHDGVILLGEDNTYGHPEPGTLALYQSIGADVYRTDQSGTIIVSATADGHYTARWHTTEN